MVFVGPLVNLFWNRIFRQLDLKWGIVSCEMKFSVLLWFWYENSIWKWIRPYYLNICPRDYTLQVIKTTLWFQIQQFSPSLLSDIYLWVYKLQETKLKCGEIFIINKQNPNILVKIKWGWYILLVCILLKIIVLTLFTYKSSEFSPFPCSLTFQCHRINFSTINSLDMSNNHGPFSL